MSLQRAPADFELAREGDVWVATHVETGVASHGDDPNEAVAMASEAVELGQQDHEPASDDVHEAFLREMGIESDEREVPIDSPSGMP